MLDMQLIHMLTKVKRYDLACKMTNHKGIKKLIRDAEKTGEAYFQPAPERQPRTDYALCVPADDRR